MPRYRKARWRRSIRSESMSLLARVGGTVYAMSGRCAHMACPLSAGKLDGYTITCPCHDWRFDVRSGAFLDAPELGLPVYPTRTEAGRLFVNLA